MKNKDEVRPVYGELQGLLSQAPPIGEHGNSSTTDSSLWNQYNESVAELNNISGQSFDKFLIQPKYRSDHRQYIDVSEYRAKLGSLIARLHHTYFYNEPAPFSGMPSTQISVAANQSQTQSQNIAIELIPVIDEKLSKLEDSPEKSFLEELKTGLSTVSDFTNLMKKVKELSAKYGISLETALSLLGLG